MQPALFLVLAACGSANSANAVESAPANSTSVPGDRPFQSAAVATFDNPWALAFLPGSHDALVTEKPGRIWLVDTSNGRKQPITGVPRVVYEGQGGLLDIVLSPTFASDHSIYLTYAEPSRNGGSGLALARAQLTRSASGGSLSRLQVLWHDPAGGEGGQFGGIIAFAPDGRSLFLSSGERQRFTPAQDPNQPLGKILHLTLDGTPAPGNPWPGKSAAASVTVTNPPDDTVAAKAAPGREVNWPGANLTPAETWTLGHRNPYGLAFDAKGRLWETEMGPKGGDELNLIDRGKNYGWPLVSEGVNYDGVPIPKPVTRPDLAPAKLFWVPSVAPTSLLIYSGRLFPQWKGSGFIGALAGQALMRVTFNGESAAKVDQWDMGARIRFVGQGPEGAIYLLEDGDNGRLLRVTPLAGRTD